MHCFSCCILIESEFSVSQCWSGSTKPFWLLIKAILVHDKIMRNSKSDVVMPQHVMLSHFHTMWMFLCTRVPLSLSLSLSLFCPMQNQPSQWVYKCFQLSVPALPRVNLFPSPLADSRQLGCKQIRHLSVADCFWPLRIFIGCHSPKDGPHWFPTMLSFHGSLPVQWPIVFNLSWCFRESGPHQGWGIQGIVQSSSVNFSKKSRKIRAIN